MDDKRIFLLDFEVEAHGCLPKDHASFSAKHPRGLYEIRLSNLAVNPGIDRPLISAHVIVQADDFEQAEASGKAVLCEYMDMLSFVTNLTYQIHKLVRIIDWSPGLKDRECHQFQAFPGHELPHAVLGPEVLKTLSFFDGAEISPKLRQILSWFRRGVRSRALDDQFQYFWFVVELLAQLDKSAEPVNDRCPKCKGPLYCEACNEHPTHRPYAKQAILAFFRGIVRDIPDELFEQSNRVRNAIAHGADVETINNELGIDMEQAVDRIGRVAWTGIYRALGRSFKIQPPEERLAMTVPSSYVHRELKMRALLVVSGDPDNPKLEQFAKTDISLVYND